MNKSFYVLMLMLLPALVFGQKLHLIDQQQQTPIPHASFQYGSQHGLSDRNGLIAVSYIPNTSLILSHLNYGERLIGAGELQAMLALDTITWSRQTYELQPISVIAIHSADGDTLSTMLSQANRLAHDAAAVLAQLSEIGLIRKSGSYGFDPVLRGFKYEQLNIVMDGAQSANAACPNRMDPPSSQMPVNMLSRITILKGPYSLRWGNGIGGTINFKSEPLLFGREKIFSGRLSGSYESNGDLWRSEGLISINRQKVIFRFYGALSTGNDYTDGHNQQVASSFYRNNIGSTLGFKLSPNQTLRINLSHNYAKNVDFPALAMDLRKDDTWLGSLHHKLVFRGHLKEWNTSLYSTLVDHAMDNYDKVIEPRMADAITDAKTYNYGGRTEGHWVYGNNKLYLGVDYRGDKAEGERRRTFLMGPNSGRTVADNIWQEAYIDKLGLFGEFQHRFNRWQIVYAGRLEYNSANANRPDEQFSSLYDQLDARMLNPGLSMGISRMLSARVKAELWLGHAQRSGSLSERYINFLPIGMDPYEMIGNPQLSAEKNSQADFSLSYTGPSAQVRISAFASRVDDYISAEIRNDIDPKLASAPGVKQFINIHKAVLRGLEATWQQQLSPWLDHRISLACTYGKNSASGEALPEIPPLDIRLALNARFMNNTLRPGVLLRHVTKQDRIAASYGEMPSPAFSVLDLSVDYRINSSLDVNARVNNLWDEHYYEHLTRSVRAGDNPPLYAPGRSFIIAMVARL